MLITIGALAMPAFVIITALARPNPVTAFEKAQAYSVETARRPEALGLSPRKIHRAVRRGLLIRTGAGQYYLDAQAVKRADRVAMGWILGASAPVVVALIWMLVT